MMLTERGRDDVALVLHGSGGRRSELEDMVRAYGLNNVIFSDLVPDKAEVAAIVAGCDACMTIYRAAREQTWSPNKMFDALAAGKPLLINVPGWLGETIENNDCGIKLDPHHPETLADALEELADDTELCRRMGKNARALAEREFDRNKLADRLENVLLEVVTNA
jgi:glycosyltransferase involved in cell wall biosynthesis